MDGDLKIEKMDFNNPSTSNVKDARPPSVNPPMKKSFSFLKSKNSRIFAGVVGLVLVFIIIVSFQAVKIFADAKKTYAQAKIAAAAIKQQNVIVAREELVKTNKEIANLKKDLDGVTYLRFIPVIGWYVGDAQHMVNASLHGVNAAIIAVDSLIPYADVLGLKGEKSFVAGSAQDRIRIAVKTLDKVVPRIDDIEKEIKLAKGEMDDVKLWHYPNFWVFKKARTQIGQVKTIADEGVYAVEQGKPLIKVLPELLGAESGKKYLIIFQNDKEQRPTGGFLTFFAVFRVEEGVVKVDSATDIYDLDDSIPTHPPAPRIIDEYLPKVNKFYIRDSNLSPDFVTSMDEFNKLYEDSRVYKEVDGIIALDTHFLVHVLDILGEVQASGLTFNSKTDPRCDCPQAVYVLEDQTTRPVNYIKENRKGLLGELLYATMQKALSSSPKEYWGRLVQAGIKDAEEKHVLFYLYDDGAQKGIEALNWGGRIKSHTGDYLHINDANFAGAKSNLYVRHTVRVDYETKGDEVKKKLTIDYRNPQKHSDCNLERGGLCLNATLRNFQRVYVPKGSTLVTSKGSQVKVKTGDDLGKTYFESFFTVAPLGKAQITYEYALPKGLVKNGKLPVLIQKQPGIIGPVYEVYVNGKKKQEITLLKDEEITLDLN